MGFADDLRAFGLKVQTRNQAVFAGVVADTKTSIVEGSPVTGAPGQPVRTGNLRASWQTAFETPTSAIISTNVAYAKPIEDGVGRFGPMTLRSKVGGWHSVALTVANFPRLVAATAERILGAT